MGRFMGGENINPLMLRVVDLLLRNHGGRDRRTFCSETMEGETGGLTIPFSWLLGVPQIQTIGGGGLGQRALFKSSGNIVCVYCMLLPLNPRVRGEHPTGQLPGTDTLPLVTCV